ncbi:glycoside hydrolase family 3 C-terminal domain-containing protein [Microbacterium hominis]|uniref:beta-xylosidase/alpha-l-arabinosidase n=1 Tax=Microbacterium TaxID=33882 RepID=UPI00168B2FEB|nr:MULTISPECIES: glycoside hydrolase family 3 N-terminal domain-containing protein [Microbacterium]QOC26526.1 glycoside hydrolase family 3 C-terminal domain-containing protein [Microbacterium hominis]QOC27699.1 glycoside hydrolase family 3 C-terminal domain-containing protein [Microbacterium hominis]QYF97166.1 glycoside hydrolase family 3 C-terminal domain-containing protein [Microbacterium sp. PAMC21962]
MTISDNSLDRRLVQPVSPRVAALMADMTPDQKVAQLVGFWVDQGEEAVAPLADEMRAGATTASDRYEQASAHGLGHLTRVYGTRPVDAAERASWLWEQQQRLRAASGHGIGAIVHEESLTGLAAWKAATFPTPLAWGAAFDPELVERMGRLIGDTMRELGVHQTLAPVLDVIRDPRWGRVDECISEDPYVVGTIATAYVRGIQDAGVHATLKHFVGYSASQAGRNHAPVHAGPRELADVFLPPFEMAVRDGGARSVMNSYTDVDGIPVASDPRLLTDLLRGEWGFDGVVVSDYFAIAFLQTMHAVAVDRTEAARLALTAGIDVELPSGDAYATPLREGLRDGRIDEALVDRALARVLAQKEELGLLDPDDSAPPTAVDLDSPAHRAVARELAERSLVLLSNDGTLPLARPGRVAVIGPNGHDASALMGCYSFANHVLAHHPGTPYGFAIPTVAEALRAELPEAAIVSVAGCDVEGDDRSGFAAAVDAAASADVAIVVVGDRAGLFGRGTVGEGNDAESLELPGVQRELAEAVAATGTPVVLVVVTGRPYALAWALDGDAGSAPAAVVQAFFPGEEGGTAIARVLTGAVAPSGRLPVSLPRSAGAQPFSYLHPILGGDSEVTSADSTPVRPFGFGLGYTTFARTGLSAPEEVAAGDELTVTVTVANTGDRAGTEIVQLYAHDVHASVVRPVAQLLGYARVSLAPGASATVRFDVPTARLAFTGRGGIRIVEPGRVDLWVGASVADRETAATVTLTGDVHRVTAADARTVATHVE